MSRWSLHGHDLRGGDRRDQALDRRARPGRAPAKRRFLHVDNHPEITFAGRFVDRVGEIVNRGEMTRIGFAIDAEAILDDDLRAVGLPEAVYSPASADRQ